MRIFINLGIVQLPCSHDIAILGQRAQETALGREGGPPIFPVLVSSADPHVQGGIGVKAQQGLKPNKTFVGIDLLQVFPLLGNLVIFLKPIVPFLHPPAKRAQFIVQ